MRIFPDQNVVAEQIVFSLAEDEPDWHSKFAARQEPERLLLLAVLQKALDDFLMRKLAREKDEEFMARRRDALEWIEGRHGDGCFTFAWACENVLGVEPDAARRAIMKMAGR